MNKCVVAVLTALLALGSAFAAVEPKFVAMGQDLRLMMAKDFEKYAAQFDATPYDGVCAYPRALLPGGGELYVKNISHGPEWTDAAFADQIPVYRKLVAEHRAFKHLFFYGFRCPEQHIAWRDDATWARYARNLGVLARFAKASGAKGILVDWEDYHKTLQFTRQGTDPGYEDCKRLARQRGRELFGAIFRDFPDATVGFFWLLSEKRRYFHWQDPVVAAKLESDLWPSFVNGIYDALPPTVRMIEASENSYRYDYKTLDFHVAADEYRRREQELLEPENRAKWKLQTEIGFSQYPDVLVRDPTEAWYIGPVAGSRLEHFRRNLSDAAELTDGYVFFWGERHPHVVLDDALLNTQRLKDHRLVTWDTRLPGFYRTLAAVKDPEKGMRDRIAELKAAGKLINLARQGVTKQLIGGVEHGEWYAVGASVKGRHFFTSVSWFEHGEWLKRYEPMRLRFEPEDANGVRHTLKLVKIPAGVDAFEVEARFHRPPEKPDWKFGEVFVYKLWPEK